MPEPPYGEILDLLTTGQVIPFLGAGVNYGTRQPGDEWKDRQSDFLPSGKELSNWLAKKIRLPSTSDRDRDDLAKVASYFVETSTRDRLRSRLQEVFNQSCTPSPIHNYLAKIARYSVNKTTYGTPLLIATTNYDDLTEKAFDSMEPPRPYDLVVYPTDREDIKGSVLWQKHGTTKAIPVATNRLFIDLESTNVIYKMHGSIDRQKLNLDSYVITEEDYVEFLSGMTTRTAVPPIFMSHFRSRHFLFLGYGLQDWNLRVILKNLKSAKPDDENVTNATRPASVLSNDRRSWAIQFRPSELETELWGARQVKIYDVDINKFVSGLEEEGRDERD